MTTILKIGVPEVYHGPLGNIVKNIFNRNQIKDNEKIKDFKDLEKKSRIWGENKYKNWSKSLDSKEKKSVNNYTKFSWDLNFYLREFNGIVEEQKEDIKDEKWKDYQNYNEEIKNIDSALAKSKTEKDIYVYRRVTEEQFYQPEQIKIRETGTKINQEIAEKIKREFIDNEFEYKDPAYVSTSLSQDPSGVLFFGMVRPILLKIRIPKGSNAAYLEKNLTHYPTQNEVLVARNSNFKYKKMSIIKTNGFESLLIELNLITSDSKYY